MQIRIDDVIIGDRFRHDMGDIDTLAQSIAEVGLLHPIVITPGNRLIAGRRRLEAYRLLGLVDIAATVVDFGKKWSEVIRNLDTLQPNEQDDVAVFCDEENAKAQELIYEANARFATNPDECAVCGYTLFIERHHFLPKEYGGTDDRRNFIYLCPTHHRAVHWLMREVNHNNVDGKTKFWNTDGKADRPLFEFYFERIAWLADILKESKCK